MSNLTNYGENLLADYFRGQSLASIPGTVYFALASAASDSAVTELSGTGYARQPVVRGLTTFAGTQASGSVLASSGISHTTSNNNAISFGTAGSAWGTANYAVMYDALTSGNALAFFPLATPIAISTSSVVSLPAGTLSCSLGLTGGMTNYLSNIVIDYFFRAQAVSFPANGYFGLYTSAPTNAGGGTEVTGGAYARQSIPLSLAGLSGTQGAGTTVASTGTSGQISNNVVIAFPTPTADWGTITHEGLFDALTGGHLLFWNPLDISRTVLSGSSPQTHGLASWAITVA